MQADGIKAELHAFDLIHLIYHDIPPSSTGGQRCHAWVFLNYSPLSLDLCLLIIHVIVETDMLKPTAIAITEEHHEKPRHASCKAERLQRILDSGGSTKKPW
jgi:hypothetical protein